MRPLFAALTLWRLWLRIMHFSVSESPRSLNTVSAQSQHSLSAVAVSLNAFAVESPTSKKFQLVQKIFNSQRSLREVALESLWVRSAFAIKLTEAALRPHGDSSATLANARSSRCESYQVKRQWRSYYCFVIYFILQNNEWRKGNGKINYSENVSYYRQR